MSGDEYEVEAILGMERRGRGRRYLFRYRGYAQEEWTARANLNEALRTFADGCDARHGDRPWKGDVPVTQSQPRVVTGRASVLEDDDVDDSSGGGPTPPLPTSPSQGSEHDEGEPDVSTSIEPAARMFREVATEGALLRMKHPVGEDREDDHGDHERHPTERKAVRLLGRDLEHDRDEGQPEDERDHPAKLMPHLLENRG